MKDTTEKCVLCGEEIRRENMNDARPLAEGKCCNSCNIGRVVPTRLNGGRPSHWGYKRNERGRWVTYAVLDETVKPIDRRQKHES